MTFSDLGIDIRKIKGKSGKIICPKCSPSRKKKTDPCLSVDLSKGVYNCHNCGWAGGLRKPKQEIEYVRPKEYNHTGLSDAMIDWFKKRGITQRTLQEFKIGEGLEWMPQTNSERNCILFPYYIHNELVNIKYRDGAKNFKLSKGAELIFFNLQSLTEASSCIITEGEIDCLTYHQSGLKHVVSVPNGASKNQRLEYLDNCIDFFGGIEKIYLATDDDEPGHALRDELARRLGHERCYRVSYFGYKDINELLQKDPLRIEDTITEASPYPIEGVYTASDIVDDIYDLRKNGLSAGAGISIIEFNNLLTFEPGYITVITGIPGHGKSEFADHLMVDLNAMHGWKWAMFSPENYPLKLHFSKIARKMHGKHFNDLSDAELETSITYFSNNFYFILPESDLSIDSILQKVHELVVRKGVNGFIIDAWNKLEHFYTDSETQYISRSLDKIDAFCRKSNVHCFIVAHPKKINKDRNTGAFEIPNLYDIAGSAAWYAKAANGITVYRDWEKEKSQILVQKVKFQHWGKPGLIELSYDKPSGRFFYNLMTPISKIENKVQQKISQPEYTDEYPF